VNKLNLRRGGASWPRTLPLPARAPRPLLCFFLRAASATAAARLASSSRRSKASASGPLSTCAWWMARTTSNHVCAAPSLVVAPPTAATPPTCASGSNGAAALPGDRLPGPGLLFGLPVRLFGLTARPLRTRRARESSFATRFGKCSEYTVLTTLAGPPLTWRMSPSKESSEKSSRWFSCTILSLSTMLMKVFLSMVSRVERMWAMADVARVVSLMIDTYMAATEREREAGARRSQEGGTKKARLNSKAHLSEVLALARDGLEQDAFGPVPSAVLPRVRPHRKHVLAHQVDLLDQVHPAVEQDVQDIRRVTLAEQILPGFVGFLLAQAREAFELVPGPALGQPTVAEEHEDLPSLG